MMGLFLFVLTPLLVVAFVSFVIARTWRDAPRLVTIVLVPMAMLAILCVAFVFVGLPDVADMAMEGVTVLLVDQHADEAIIQGWFRDTGADWHLGAAWESGESFSSPPAPCRSKCTKELQVAYTWWRGLCFISGDRLTILFDERRKVENWSIDPAVDGC